MHHLVDNMTKLCHGKKQDGADWEGIPVYDSFRENVFLVVCRGGDLLLCQRVNEFRLPVVRH